MLGQVEGEGHEKETESRRPSSYLFKSQAQNGHFAWAICCKEQESPGQRCENARWAGGSTLDQNLCWEKGREGCGELPGEWSGLPSE